MRLDLAVAHVDDRNLVHLNAPLAVFRIQPENKRAVLAHAKIIVRQLIGHLENPKSMFTMGY